MFLNRVFATLRRPTASSHYYPEVDGLRFVAIAIVIISHVYAAWQYQPSEAAANAASAAQWPALVTFFLKRNDMGVLIFFVLSAYVISMPFVRAARTGARLSLKNYYLRR